MCQKVHYLYPTIYSRYSMTRLRNTVTTMLLLRYTFFSITYYGKNESEFYFLNDHHQKMGACYRDGMFSKNKFVPLLYFSVFTRQKKRTPPELM